MSVYYIKNNSIDNFEQVRQIIYAGAEDKILTKEELKEQNKEELYNDTTIFESDSPFIGYPIRHGNTIRPATRLELINMGYQNLEDGEYIEDEEIKKIEQPSWQYKWVIELKKWIPDESTIQDGQYIEGEKIIDVPYDDSLGYLIPAWDNLTHTWKEGATEEQKTEQYKYLINSYKAKILEQGFNYNEHQQKCREKDLALLGNAVAALDDMATFSQSEEKKINWAFNDDDITIMSETDLRKLRMAGCEFINNVYKIEAELKASEVNLKLTGKEFIDKINAVSQVKCYFNDIKETDVQSLEKFGGGTNLSTYNILSKNKNTRIQNLNARATAISLNSIDEKVRSLEGTSRAVPIDMKSLDDRINNLIATAQSYQIINYNDRTGTNITSKYGMKLNSNSTVAILNASVYSFSTKTSYGPVKGDFSLLTASNKNDAKIKYYIERKGNNILLTGYKDTLQSGSIIIFN